MITLQKCGAEFDKNAHYRPEIALGLGGLPADAYLSIGRNNKTAPPRFDSLGGEHMPDPLDQPAPARPGAPATAHDECPVDNAGCRRSPGPA